MTDDEELRHKRVGNLLGPMNIIREIRPREWCPGRAGRKRQAGFDGGELG
jgi:hypothetical protein